MNPISKYDVYFGGKQNGFYSFTYDLGNDFFTLFPNLPVREGSLTAHLELEKKSNLLILDFKITGRLIFVCDNCLESFSSSVSLTAKQFVKLDDNYEELDDTTISIPRNSEKINIAQWVFEAIALSIPIRKVHPLDKNGNPTCNPEMLQKIETLSHKNQIEKDPRWDKLTALLN
ncbi:MAG: DUF177 domain-containing protein [Bacteroidales bacterium]|nr:DUF177 domain-containing protein [Bacteroidales bacterium]